jgi:hypothetical protein
MTVRDLMAGYTAYTDAEELTAMRGTHRDDAVTTTDTLTTTLLADLSYLSDATDLDRQEDATGAPVLTVVNHGR